MSRFKQFRSAICAAHVLMFSLLTTTGQAALTYAPWDTSQTSLFFQGAESEAGIATWTGNNLTLEYSKALAIGNGAAWASTTNRNSFDQSQVMPSPATAVGIAFDVSASYYPTIWVVQLDLGSYTYGFGASDTVRSHYGSQVVADSGGGIPDGAEPYDPLQWSFFAPVDYTFSNGVWHVEMFYPDQWLFNRDSLSQRFKFFATNTEGGASQLVDGITQINDVRWILSDPFPTAPPNGDGNVPEPASLAIWVGLVIIAAGARRRRRMEANPTHPILANGRHNGLN